VLHNSVSLILRQATKYYLCGRCEVRLVTKCRNYDKDP